MKHTETSLPPTALAMTRKKAGSNERQKTKQTDLTVFKSSVSTEIERQKLAWKFWLKRSRRWTHHRLHGGRDDNNPKVSRVPALWSFFLNSQKYLILEKLTLGFLCLFKVLKQNLILYRESYTAFLFSSQMQNNPKPAAQICWHGGDEIQFCCFFFLKPLIDFLPGS